MTTVSLPSCVLTATADPCSMRKNSSPASPSLMTLSPSANVRDSRTSAILDRSCGWSEARMGTSERKASYSLRLREVCYNISPKEWPGTRTSRRMVRNETRSNAHRVHGVVDMIEAARGALQSAMPMPKRLTCASKPVHRSCYPRYKLRPSYPAVACHLSRDR